MENGMLRSFLVLTCACCIVTGAHPALGQEAAPAAPEEAAIAPALEPEPVPATAQSDLLPTPPNELTLRYGGELGSDINLQEEININLIDLDALRIRLSESVADQQFNLSLQECILIALDENMDIQVTGFEPLKSDEAIYAAKGEFDPILQGSAFYSRANQSQSQQVVAFGGINSVQSYDTVTNAALLGKLQFGTQYNLTWGMNKSESTFSNFVEEYSGTLTLQLTQPILRGFGTKYNKVRINLAKNSRIATEAQLRLTVLTTVADVIKGYWDLVGAMENLKVQSEALDNAERLLKVNETRREIGTAADIEVLQAKAGVATRQSQYITARQRIADASNLLKNHLNLRDGDRFSKALIVPIDRPNPRDPAEFDASVYEERVVASMDEALAKRPEITIRQMEIDSSALEEYRARKEMLPQLDLVYQYTSGGRDHKLSETLSGIQERQDYAYSYGIQASIPILNRAARGNYQRARLARRQAELTLDQARQQLMLNVNLAASRVASNAILVQSNQQATRLQIANVAAEEKRLQLGVTTSWQVLQIQQDLTTAQVQELISNIEYEKSLVELQLAEGTLLDNLGIELPAPVGEDAPVTYLDSVRPRWE
jgi:outer membrane protein TolC